jgi:hypothetical protein
LVEEAAWNQECEMKIFYPVLIATAGISFANASEAPKEGTYDYIACWSGTSSEMKLPGGGVAQTNEFTGMITAKTPGSMFDNNSFRCIGFFLTKDKAVTGRNVCEAVDADGDRRWASFVVGEDGKTTRAQLAGTGKWDGLVTTNMVVENMPTPPTIVPGTVQGCNHQTGTYKLK